MKSTILIKSKEFSSRRTKPTCFPQNAILNTKHQKKRGSLQLSRREYISPFKQHRFYLKKKTVNSARSLLPQITHTTDGFRSRLLGASVNFGWQRPSDCTETKATQTQGRRSPPGPNRLRGSTKAGNPPLKVTDGRLIQWPTCSGLWAGCAEGYCASSPGLVYDAILSSAVPGPPCR